jgi:hypothetical protein
MSRVEKVGGLSFTELNAPQTVLDYSSNVTLHGPGRRAQGAQFKIFGEFSCRT